MTATFGQLQGRVLELREGLNILQSPNESGKSTWCAFLASMLYGINSRERDRAGFIADKNRYAPWSGTTMSGRLDCATELGELTLTRTTRRQSSPMGEFSAVYAGTGDPVPDLTGRTCGETLLGVSREVFERSAFIRQSGLAVTQDAGLERRIAALISAGEEDTSYSEALEALKKQLNRRRHNKTGLLPTLEASLSETERQLTEVSDLENRLAQVRTQVESLSAQEAALTEELSIHDRWEAVEKRQALSNAESNAKAAEERASVLRRRAEEERLPENDTIGRLRGAIVNLQTVRKSVEKARAERDEAMKALLKAEAAVGESPFAGQSPDSARKEASASPAPADWRKGPGLLVIVLGTIAAFVLFYAAAVALSGSPWQKPASIGVLLAGLCITYILARRLRRRAIQEARDAALAKRFGTADADAIQSMADTYCKLCEARDAAQEIANAKTATADALYASLSSNEQGILLEVRRFAPCRLRHSHSGQPAARLCRAPEGTGGGGIRRPGSPAAGGPAGRAGCGRQRRLPVRSAGAEPGSRDRPVGTGPGAVGRRPLRRRSVDRPPPRRGRPGGVGLRAGGADGGKGEAGRRVRRSANGHGSAGRSQHHSAKPVFPGPGPPGG